MQRGRRQRSKLLKEWLIGGGFLDARAAEFGHKGSV